MVNKRFINKVEKKVINRLIAIMFFFVGGSFIFEIVKSYIEKNFPEFNILWLGLIMITVGSIIMVKMEGKL